MKHSLKELKSYNIITMDGSETKIRDILFDEESWIIRYLEADFGTLFSKRKILIPRTLFKSVNEKTKILFTDMTKDDISRCPKPEDDEPVSRKYEEELNKYYGTDIYWSYTYPYIGGGAGPNFPGSPRVITTASVNENDLGTNLHSYNEVTGYSIHALDGKLGHVDDFIADDITWNIAYIVVDTVNWLPWSKKVVLSVKQIEDISYENREAKVNTPIETIRHAPEFDHAQPISEQYEQALREFYDKSYINHNY